MSHTWIQHISASQYCSIHATPTCSTPCPCPPLQSRDQTTLPPAYPSWDRKELAGSLCLSLLRLPAVSSPARCQNSHGHHDLQRLWDRGGQKRQAKQAKTGQGVTITWDSQWAKELVMERCHTCHYLSLPKTRYSAVTPKQHQCNERFTSYWPPLIQNTPNFWERLHRQLQSSFSRTRPLMFTKLCVLQDFLTSARLHTCRMWVFTATTKLVTANTFWLKCEVHVQLNSTPKWS